MKVLIAMYGDYQKVKIYKNNQVLEMVYVKISIRNFIQCDSGNIYGVKLV
jgi:hypothetical protein